MENPQVRGLYGRAGERAADLQERAEDIRRVPCIVQVTFRATGSKPGPDRGSTGGTEQAVDEEGMTSSGRSSGRTDRGAVNIIDVAHLAGVSRQTVSNVVNDRGGFSEETRSKVLRVIAETGYKPNRAARQLRTNRARHIGFPLHTGHVRPAQPLHAAVPEGCRRGGETTGAQPDRLRVRRRGRRDLPLLGPQRRGRRLRLRPGGAGRLPDQGAGRAGRALLGDGAHRRVRGAELGGHRQPVRDDEPGRLPRRQGASAVRVRRQRRLRALGRRPRRRRSRAGRRARSRAATRGRCCARATTRSWATSSTRC